MSKTITQSQKSFALEKIEAIRISRARKQEPDQLATDIQVSAMRAVAGAGNGIVSQSRPDLSRQVSLSLQTMPKPSVHDVGEISHMVRRAKQFADLEVRYIRVDTRYLALVVHTGAAWGNARNNGTQAGCIVGFTHRGINAGVEVPWPPAVWRPYRLSRAIPFTLSGEAQALATGFANVEWMDLCISELLDGPSSLHGMSVALHQRPPTYSIDCKSLYDHVMAPSAPITLEDKRSSIDIIIIRESLQRCRGVFRWVPTDRMLADVLTKNRRDPADLLRACVRNGTYQINEEGHLMAITAQDCFPSSNRTVPLRHLRSCRAAATPPRA